MKRFDEIVRAYLHKELVEDDGVIELPPELFSVTQDGRVYVTHAPWGTALLFVTWRGKGSNLRGHVYSTDLGGVVERNGQQFSVELIGPVNVGRVPR